MPAERRGTIEPAGTWPDGSPRFRFRLRLGDGTKSRRFDVPQGRDERRARTYVAEMQALEDMNGALLAAKRAEARERAVEVGAGVDGETCDAWYERYRIYQRQLGRTTDELPRWRKWISPRLGPKPMAIVTRDDIEDVRDSLDRAVDAWKREGKGEDRIAGKTAMNVWSAMTSAFKAATSSKRRELRVRADNPCIGVEPPGDSDSRRARRKPFVYPKECASLLACAAVPREWREAHAIAAYTYLRPGELRVLTWGDVDLDAGLIHVTKAWDYRAAAVKVPKTRNGVRRVPIEPALAPLLARMRKGQAVDALVVPVLSSFREGRAREDQLAIVFRRHLRCAEVNRAALHETGSTHVRANFRSWRDSGLTWLAMTGLGVDKISRRAGHDMVQTTMGYVKQAEDLTGDLGTPFAPLPDELIAGTCNLHASNDDADDDDARLGHPLAQSASNPAKHLYRRRDSNPEAHDASAEVRALQAGDASLDTSIGARHPVDAEATGPAIGPADDVENALTRALEAATTAGRFDVVAQLARELEARRLAREPNVIALDTSRPRRGQR